MQVEGLYGPFSVPASDEDEDPSDEQARMKLEEWRSSDKSHR